MNFFEQELRKLYTAAMPFTTPNMWAESALQDSRMT